MPNPPNKFPDLPVPEGLQKRGLTGYDSNLPEGQEVRPNMAVFAHLLGGEELVRDFRKWQRRKHAAADCNN